MPNNLGPSGQPLNKEMQQLYGMIPAPNPNNNYNIGAIQQIIPRNRGAIQQIIPRPNPQPIGGKRKVTRKARKATRKARKAKRKTRK